MNACVDLQRSVSIESYEEEKGLIKSVSDEYEERSVGVSYNKSDRRIASKLLGIQVSWY